MARKQLQDGATATGAGLTFEPDGTVVTFQVIGITTATVDLEGTLDGTNWDTIGTALTADGFSTVTGSFNKVRANISAYTSGTIDVWVQG